MESIVTPTVGPPLRQREFCSLGAIASEQPQPTERLDNRSLQFLLRMGHTLLNRRRFGGSDQLIGICIELSKVLN